MAYPIQTLSDGRIKYSDGSIRGTSKTGFSAPQQTVAQSLFKQGAKTSAKPSVTGNPVTVLPGGQSFQTPSQEVMNTPTSSLNADILRSKFGFNDQNVINAILNDPNRRAQYEREMNPQPSPQQNFTPSTPSDPFPIVAPAPRKSFADILTENNSLFSTPKSPVPTAIVTPSPTGMESAKLNTNFTIEDNPQFLDFKALWNNILNPHEGDWNKLLASDQKTMDFGFSEFFKPKIAYAAEKNTETGAETGQSGVLMSPDINNLKSGASNLTTGSEVYAVQTLADGRIKMSDGTIKSPNGGNSFADLISKNGTTPDYKLGKAEKTATEILKEKVATGSATPNDIFTIIDPNIEEQIKGQAEQIYNNGGSEAEVAAYIQKAAEDALNVEYERLNTEAGLNIPKYERYAQESIDEINTNQKDIENLGTTTKDETNNTYAEKLLQSQLSKRADDTKLRNLFSNLGTSESSAFIENMAKNTSDYGKYNTELDVANIKSVGQIDTEVLKAKTSASKQITSITKDKDEKIAAVEANQQLYPKEKYAEKQKIAAEYKVNMQSIYQDISDKTSQLQNLKLEFMMGQSNITQNGKISSDLLQKEYDLTQTKQNEIASKIPPELDQELTGFSINPQSSMANNLKKDKLKSMYPEFADMIEQVYSSGANYNTIRSQIGVA